jgi:hypothetical protein
MPPQVVAFAVGPALIVLGVLIIAFGDRQVGDKRREGVIARAFSMPPLNVRVLKWVIGIGCIWLGVAAVLTRGHLVYP